jgi:hypothetical protein
VDLGSRPGDPPEAGNRRGAQPDGMRSVEPGEPPGLSEPRDSAGHVAQLLAPHSYCLPSLPGFPSISF